MTRQSRIAPLFAALVATALILTHLAGLGHYILVSHYFCAEHGTLHHGSPDVSAGIGDEANPVDSATQTTRSEHHHEDCGCFARAAEAAIEAASLGVVALETEACVAFPVREADAHVALPVLSLAPKQSPTSAA